MVHICSAVFKISQKFYKLSNNVKVKVRSQNKNIRYEQNCCCEQLHVFLYFLFFVFFFQ